MTAGERRLRDDLTAAAAPVGAAGDWDDVVRRSTGTTPASPPATPGPGRRRPALLALAAAAVVLVVALAVGTIGGGDQPGRVDTAPGPAATQVTAGVTAPETEGPSTSTTPGTTSTPVTPATPTTATSAPTPDPETPLDVGSVDLTARCPANDHVTFRLDDGAGPAGATITSGGPQLADLDGDGVDEAVLSLRCSAPGGRTSDSVVVVGADGGGRQLGDPIPGIEPVIIEGVVVVRQHQAATTSTDPRTVHVPYRLGDGGLVEGGGGSPLTADDRALTSGVGSLRVAMTYAELAAALGQRVETSWEPTTGDTCRYVTVPAGPTGVGGLGDRHRLRSVSVTDPAFRTRSGIGVGSSEDQVRAAYPGRLQEEPGPFNEGELILTLHAAGDPLAAVFFTYGGAVTSYRVGELDSALLTEGCH